MKIHLFALNLVLICSPAAASKNSPFSPLFVPEVGQVITNTTLAFNAGRYTTTSSGGITGHSTDNPRYSHITQSVIVGLPWDGFSVGAAASYSESLKNDTDRFRYMEGFSNPSFLFNKTFRFDSSDVIHVTYSTSPKTGSEGIRATPTTHTLSATSVRQFGTGIIGSAYLGRMESSFADSTGIAGTLHKNFNGVLWGTTFGVVRNDRQKETGYEVRIAQTYSASMFASRQLSSGLWGGMAYTYWKGKQKLNIDEPFPHMFDARIRTHAVSASLQASF